MLVPSGPAYCEELGTGEILHLETRCTCHGAKIRAISSPQSASLQVMRKVSVQSAFPDRRGECLLHTTRLHKQVANIWSLLPGCLLFWMFATPSRPYYQPPFARIKEYPPTPSNRQNQPSGPSPSARLAKYASISVAVSRHSRSSVEACRWFGLRAVC